MLNELEKCTLCSIFFFLFFFHQPFVYLLFFGIILCSWFIFFISFCQEFGKKSFTITKLRSLREKRKCLALFFFFFLFTVRQRKTSLYSWRVYVHHWMRPYNSWFYRLMRLSLKYCHEQNGMDLQSKETIQSPIEFYSQIWSSICDVSCNS